jgi:aminoglycoside/choline kinase family phosphotransferase
MPALPGASDPELWRWVCQQTAGPPVRWQPIPGDASLRRYHRLHWADHTRVLMDAREEPASCAPFAKVAGLLRAAGVNAPAVLAWNAPQGWMLLEDLGERAYLDALQTEPAEPLIRSALEALIRWQGSSRPNVLPPYDRARLAAELALFPDWYVDRHLGRPFTTAQQRAWDAVASALIDAALAQSRVFVHRDFMARNLLVSTPNPGVIDFQDALEGPVTYDVASLLRDAFISWPEAQTQEWALFYWEQARHAGIAVPPAPEDFLHDLDWMGTQRHLKVLGIFARLSYRDGKPRYLAEAPRFLAYLDAAIGRQSNLAPLGELLADLHAGRSAP